MYEPIRTPSSRGSVHTMADTPADFPHRSREEELDIQLAGHLAALLAVTDELRTASPSTDLDTAAARLAQQVSRLRGGRTPVRSPLAADLAKPRLTAAHERAHALAGRALLVAASRADTSAAILAAQRMDAHAAALGETAELSATG
ncbi:SCO4983 family protein [Streptomyces sp. IBSBF 2806]|uniref:SCO4983 family protein n=1 Tax=Streptomyces sp. IBSBF 2806 TaxID=2903529 RepID=UPI002FDC70A9